MLNSQPQGSDDSEMGILFQLQETSHLGLLIAWTQCPQVQHDVRGLRPLCGALCQGLCLSFNGAEGLAPEQLSALEQELSAEPDAFGVIDFLIGNAWT